MAVQSTSSATCSKKAAPSPFSSPLKISRTRSVVMAIRISTSPRVVSGYAALLIDPSAGLPLTRPSSFIRFLTGMFSSERYDTLKRWDPAATPRSPRSAGCACILSCQKKMTPEICRSRSRLFVTSPPYRVVFPSFAARHQGVPTFRACTMNLPGALSI